MRSKFEPHRVEVLLAEIRAGHTYEVACAMAGINYQTFRVWVVRGGKASVGAYHEFKLAVEKAEAEGERAALERVKVHARLDGQSARWLLERRYPHRWGPPRHDIGDGSATPAVQQQAIIVNIVSQVPRPERPTLRPAPLAVRVAQQAGDPTPSDSPAPPLPPAQPQANGAPAYRPAI